MVKTETGIYGFLLLLLSKINIYNYLWTRNIILLNGNN